MRFLRQDANIGQVLSRKYFCPRKKASWSNQTGGVFGTTRSHGMSIPSIKCLNSSLIRSSNFNSPIFASFSNLNISISMAECTYYRIWLFLCKSKFVFIVSDILRLKLKQQLIFQPCTVLTDTMQRNNKFLLAYQGFRLCYGVFSVCEKHFFLCIKTKLLFELQIIE